MSERLRIGVLLSAVAAGLWVAVAWAIRVPVDSGPMPDVPSADELQTVGRTVSKAVQLHWQAEGAPFPAEMADELLILRRLSLALHGTIPSLEEIRRFEADDQPQRLLRWTSALLDENRFAAYFAERLARTFVGTDGGQFVIFRRDRFTDWLAGELRKNTAYDEIVRQMISSRGLWTGVPATNFLTAAYNNDEFDANQLAGRSVRAFLGQRIDCAQCHDAFFADWKQSQFQGLAAFYGQTVLSLDGVIEQTTASGQPLEFRVDDLSAAANVADTLMANNEDGLAPAIPQRVVSPAVPFGEDWLPEQGTRRERLAAWITHPENRRFDRAIVNRVWGLMMGRPLKTPVDDMPNPPAEADLISVLADDFREHGRDLRRLILNITQSPAFRVESVHPGLTESDFWQAEQAGAIFPVTRLRPEQLIGAMLQAASLRTIDRNSHLFVRAIRLIRERDFVRAYGDAGENELEERAATISQALLRMNGRLVKEVTSATPFSSSGRVVAAAGSDEVCLETLFLLYLTRRPTEEERSDLLPLLKETTGQTRNRVVEDLVWALVNSEEFSWNH